MQTRALVLAAVAVALVLPGCGSDDDSSKAAKLPGKGKPPVRLATKNFTEQYVLGQLYAQALRARGFTIDLKENVGSSEIVDRALGDGVIDVYPEYIGVIAQELARDPSRPKTADETYRRARAYEEKRGFTILTRTPGFDADANVVKPALARKYHLKSTADLKKLGRFRYGGPPENKNPLPGAGGERPAHRPHQPGLVPPTIQRRYK